jgi:hypothetical protein
MKVGVLEEKSQEVCKAFREKGHEAYSIDISPCYGGRPEWHRQQDAKEALEEFWDMLICFPPCTDLAVSGAKWFAEKRKDGRQQKSIDFFMIHANNKKCPKISIENPIGIMSTIWRKPDQIIQPYWFGHMEQKSTCLWLKGLPKLKPTHNVYSEMMALPKKKRERIHYLPPGPDRADIRSKTFPGIARAMAEQWGNL